MTQSPERLVLGMLQDPCRYESVTDVVRQQARSVYVWIPRKGSFDAAFDAYFGEILASGRKSDREKELIRASRKAMELEIKLFRHLWEVGTSLETLRSFESEFEILRECSRGVYILMQRGMGFEEAFTTYFAPWQASSEVSARQREYIAAAKKRMSLYMSNSSANW